MHITVYDATLREGAQGPGASFSLEDRLRMVELLDALGVDYIEAGQPTASRTDVETFRQLAQNPPKTSRLAAFGSTRRPGIPAERDEGLNALLLANTPSVTIFGKCWDLHVDVVLRTSLDENLAMIEDSVRFLKEAGREVIFDAEHFFDGCRDNEEYAFAALFAAKKGGADWICLCDTNGGTLPEDISRFTAKAVAQLGIPVGIHCHNDSGLAVANSMAAVVAGATMVQVTLNGWGERCGNADFFTLIPNLQLKMGYHCICPEAMPSLCSFSRDIYEMMNRPPDKRAPYVGKNAFSHKAGMHIDAVEKNPLTFEHVPPESVGATRQFLLSRMSGRSAVFNKIREIDSSITKDSEAVKEITELLKEMESDGYLFEGAEASFELMVRRKLGLFKPFFHLEEYKVVGTSPADEGHTCTAMVRLSVNGVQEINAADGYGPVNALDIAARKALERFYPELKQMRLSDFKVRVLSSKSTASKVRVLIESTDGVNTWTTVGVDYDIMQASSIALFDSLEYMLMKTDAFKEVEP
ncbi:MAG: citramalate synthase [Christensenellales bacterium]